MDKMPEVIGEKAKKRVDVEHIAKYNPKPISNPTYSVNSRSNVD